MSGCKEKYITTYSSLVSPLPDPNTLEEEDVLPPPLRREGRVDRNPSSNLETQESIFVDMSGAFIMPEVANVAGNSSTNNRTTLT
ncbi:hypothetical protein TSUD_254560 [Trifolium subterraneum]|uniref:Uncharacterized protein n=1 Tax=Trifolium subterraneum TaxID=3900 RepID=A0A2Z6PAG5_TRISU|nr:hypothetical protein TSUD_254560 [Trifolium subterraneum]